MKRNRSDPKSPRAPSGAAVRSTDLTERLVRALFEEWAETGYAAISLERVAGRAGAGKAAIYRRWSSKLQFAREALDLVALDITDISDQGSLEADLLAYLRVLRRVLRHRLVRRILPDLHAERLRSKDLAELLERLTRQRRARGEEILIRGIERGELPANIDRAMALDLLPAALYWRMIVTDGHASVAELRAQARCLCAALRAC